MYIDEYQLGIAVGVIIIAFISIVLIAYNVGKKNAAKVAVNVFRSCFGEAEYYTPNRAYPMKARDLYSTFASQVAIKLKVTRHLYRDGKLINNETKKPRSWNRSWSNRRNRVVNITDKSR